MMILGKILECKLQEVICKISQDNFSRMVDDKKLRLPPTTLVLHVFADIKDYGVKYVQKGRGVSDPTFNLSS